MDQSAKIIGLAPYLLKRRKPILTNAVRRLSERSLREMLQYSSKIDRLIKGLDKGNVWDELLTLTLYLGGQPPITRLSLTAQ